MRKRVDGHLVDDRETGFVLADQNLKPMYANSAASLILCYPNQASIEDFEVQKRVQSILEEAFQTPGLQPVTFLSGRRSYVCRTFLIDARRNGARAAMVALVLERRPADPVDISSVSRHFHLSRRESETVRLLVQGLTTKEVAERMGVSPHTVKQFVRLIMTKMGVTTRSGIVGKLIAVDAR